MQALENALLLTSCFMMVDVSFNVLGNVCHWKSGFHNVAGTPCISGFGILLKWNNKCYYCCYCCYHCSSPQLLLLISSRASVADTNIRYCDKHMCAKRRIQAQWVCTKVDRQIKCSLHAALVFENWQRVSCNLWRLLGQDEPGKVKRNLPSTKQNTDNNGFFETS